MAAIPYQAGLMINTLWKQGCRFSRYMDAQLQQSPYWDMGTRTVLALLGGYGFTAIMTASLSLALPLPKAQAVLTATLLSFSLYSGVILWAFSAATAWRAWCWILGLALFPTLHLLMWGLWA